MYIAFMEENLHLGKATQSGMNVFQLKVKPHHSASVHVSLVYPL